MARPIVILTAHPIVILRRLEADEESEGGEDSSLTLRMTKKLAQNDRSMYEDDGRMTGMSIFAAKES